MKEPLEYRRVEPEESFRLAWATVWKCLAWVFIATAILGNLCMVLRHR